MRPFSTVIAKSSTELSFIYIYIYVYICIFHPISSRNSGMKGYLWEVREQKIGKAIHVRHRGTLHGHAFHVTRRHAIREYGNDPDLFKGLYLTFTRNHTSLFEEARDFWKAKLGTASNSMHPLHRFPAQQMFCMKMLLYYLVQACKNIISSRTCPHYS